MLRFYGFDHLDRLMCMEYCNHLSQRTGSSNFVYDYASRCVAVRETDGNFREIAYTTRMFDGLDVVRESTLELQLNGQQIETKAQLVRDGGVGGILSRTTLTGDKAFYGYDGNGNVTLLTDASGTEVGRYRYDAFGVTLEAIGTKAADNPYRFSTKEQHGASGLYDFGYRFYSPGMGRWINRDPLGEEGGINLYVAMGNNAVNSIDEYGEDAYVSYNRKSNRVTITLPINFYWSKTISAKEAKAAIAQFKRGIVRYWSGKKGKYNASVRVTNKAISYTDEFGLPTTLINKVYLYSKGRSYVVGSTGYWFIKPYDQQFTGAHEAGHFMGLIDRYYERTKKPHKGWGNNIMGKYGKPVQERNITDILNGPDVGGNRVLVSVSGQVPDPKDGKCCGGFGPGGF